MITKFTDHIHQLDSRMGSRTRSLITYDTQRQNSLFDIVYLSNIICLISDDFPVIYFNLLILINLRHLKSNIKYINYLKAGN